MRLALYLLDGAQLVVEDFPEGDALELLAEWEDGECRTGTLTMDDTARVTYAWQHVTRVDCDWEATP